MSVRSERLAKIRQEIEDMDYVMSKASEMGLSMGDYDLQSLTAQRKDQRLKEAQM